MKADEIRRPEMKVHIKIENKNGIVCDSCFQTTFIRPIDTNALCSICGHYIKEVHNNLSSNKISDTEIQKLYHLDICAHCRHLLFSVQKNALFNRLVDEHE